jgi:DUF971 family protein
MTERRNEPAMKRLKEVGRYAVGIEWGDGHDSILPYRDIRMHCPCERCDGAVRDVAPGTEPADLQRIGDGTLFFRWADGHETLMVAEELRALCRCAHCVGEPDYPVTGR